MANNPFDREIINARERPISGDHNLAWAQLDQSQRTILEVQTLARTGSGTFPDAAKSPRKDGFLADGFKVRPNAAGANNLLFITSGLGFQDGLSGLNPPDTQINISAVTNLNDVAGLKPLVLSAAAAEATTGIAVPAAPGVGNSRIDIIEVRVNRVLGSPTSRDILDIGSGIFAPAVVNKNLSYLLNGTASVVQQPDATTTAAIKYKKGVVSITTDPTVPAVPTTTPGYIKIAEIFVSGINTVFDSNLIKDTRTLICNYGQAVVSCSLRLEKPGGVIQGSLTNVVAPPGVVVAATGETDDLLGLIISPGVGWIPTNPVMLTVGQVSPSQIATFGGLYTPQAAPGASLITLTAAQTAQLADPARTNPTVKLAVGQQVLYFGISVIKQSVATGVPSTVSMSGGGNFWLVNALASLNRS